MQDTSAPYGVNCGLADSTGALVVVNYTAAKYTKYIFTMKMTEPGGTTIIAGGDQVPHGDFKPCNRDGTRTHGRGKSPEFLFDNSWSWGYGLVGPRAGSFSHRYDFTDRNDARYINADPSNGVALPWEIVMEWKDNDLKIVSWKVAGSDFSYPGERGGCPDNNNNYGFTPRLFAYRHSTFFLKDFAYSQAETIQGL